MKPSEPERAAEAREARRSGESKEKYLFEKFNSYSSRKA